MMCVGLLRASTAATLAAILALTAVVAATPANAEAAGLWQGFVKVDQANVRGAPSTSAPIVAVLGQGDTVTVAGWVSGQEVETENNTWAHLTTGGYLYSGAITRSKPATPPPLPAGPISGGKWIDVNVTQQILTAYVGSTPVHIAVVSTGRPDYPTPKGTFKILSRVANATMDSSSVPWVKDHYRLENVLFTQYFTQYGAALHEAWWKTDDSFGIPTSHGCVGMPYAEAQWVWNWAAVGTPVYVHE
jgi:lipoprotein-anchoring transpeptidase ErfK/SrfK